MNNTPTPHDPIHTPLAGISRRRAIQAMLATAIASTLAPFARAQAAARATPVHHRGLQTVLLEQYDSDTVARLAKVCARASNTASNHQMIELGGILPYFNNIPKGAPYRNVESYLLPKFFAENSARRLALTSYLSFHRNDIDAVNDSAALTERASQFNAFAGRVAATYAGKVVLKVGFQLEDTVDQATAETLLTQIAGQFTFNPAAVAFKLVRCPSGDVDSADRGVTSQLRVRGVDGVDRTFSVIREIHGVLGGATGYEQFSNDGNFVFSKQGFRLEVDGRRTTAREASDSFPNASDGIRHDDNENIDGLRKAGGTPPKGVQVILLHRPAYNGLIGATRIERRRGINTLIYDKTSIGDPQGRGVITLPAHELALASRFLG